MRHISLKSSVSRLTARVFPAGLLCVVLAGTFFSRNVWAQQQASGAATPDSSAIGTPSSADRFGRYNLIEECAMHAVRMERQYWRDKDPDTVAIAPWGNPYQRSTITSVRACLARFSVAATPVRDLLFLGRAYLVAEQDAKADSAFRRLLTANASKSVTERAWLLQQIVSATVEVSPMRLATADRYLAELDGLGAAAAASRMIAHSVMAQAGSVADSVAMQGIHAKAAVAAGKEMVGDDRKQRVQEEAFARTLLIDWHLRRAVYDSARIEARATVADLSGRRRYVTFNGFTDRVDWIGTKAPQLERTWTFNNPDSASFPAVGKPTLLILSSAVCGSQCYAGYAPIRRLANKYAAAGVRFVIMTRTFGFTGEHLQTPAQEAEKTRAFFLDHLKLPVSISMVEIKYRFRDDGVRLDERPSWLQAYYNRAILPGYTSTILVGPDGNVRIAGPLNTSTERRFDHLLAELLEGRKAP